MSTAGVSQTEAIFYQQYESMRRDEVVGVLLAVFLGSFGAHRFYLRQPGAAVLYLLFCWTAIPSMVALVECFFMPGRVRAYNALAAAMIASSLGLAAPPWNYPARVYARVAALPVSAEACAQCGTTNPPEARFCAHCGAAL